MEHAQLESQRLNVKEKELNFSSAKTLAENYASSCLSEPMLIAWFDGKKGEEHPHVPECQHKPGWLAYAEGHGGRIRVDVNEYSFIFTDAGVTDD
jgi:hypothetical protein